MSVYEPVTPMMSDRDGQYTPPNENGFIIKSNDKHAINQDMEEDLVVRVGLEDNLDHLRINQDLTLSPE